MVFGTELMTAIIIIVFYFEENNTHSVLSQTYKSALRIAAFGHTCEGWSRCQWL